MLKYVDTKVVFQEIPNEITLAINISNCPCHCEGCHSSYLAENIGKELTVEALHELVRANSGITCVAFMGGDSDPEELNKLAFSLKLISWHCFKVAWYSGRQELSDKIDLFNFNYIKLGPYIKEKGPLNSKTTNQRLYKVLPSKELEDITYEFWNSKS